jgi:hypothetical protein
MPSNAFVAVSAMLAPERLLSHTADAKRLTIEASLACQVFNDLWKKGISQVFRPGEATKMVSHSNEKTTNQFLFFLTGWKRADSRIKSDGTEKVVCT